MKLNYPKILFTLSILSFIVFVAAIYFDLNHWFLISFLSSIGFGNWGGHLLEIDEWNNGICKKTGKPWDFESSEMLSDCSVVYYFKSEKHSYLSQYIELEQIKKQYKGETKWK